MNMKEKIRREVLCRRRRIPEAELKERSEGICRRLVMLDEFQNSANLLIYVSMADEFQTMAIFQACLELRKLLIVPIVRSADDLLLLSALTESHVSELLSGTAENGGVRWNRSKFGILEPCMDSVKPVPIPDVELIVVPGLGFDRSGMRLGFGGGHYDRLLANCNETTHTIAPAFDFQMYGHIPHDTHDQRVGMIITEHEIIRPPSAIASTHLSRVE